MAHRLPILSSPVLRVFSKYILAVMADKSDEELQRIKGFTSRSDSYIDVVNLSFGQIGCFDYIHTHLNSYAVWKTNINWINFVDKPHAWHTTCYIKAYLSVLDFNTQINLYLSASVYKSMCACLFSIHCFYVYWGYEKRSISEVVKDFNNNIDLVKWYINIIWLVAFAIVEN
jgi:hypothetical protein